MNFTLPVGISNRHMHLSQHDLELLFGKNYQLTPQKDLSQTGQFAAVETIDLKTSKGTIPRVRILGPVRPETQIELSLTDTFKLGIRPPIRESGQIEDTPGLTLLGPAGTVDISRGVIIASRHIHMNETDASNFRVNNGQVVSVYSKGPRSIIFNNVVIRVRHDFVLDFHIDTDEANAAGLCNGEMVTAITEPLPLP